MSYPVSDFYVDKACEFLQANRPRSFTTAEVADALGCSYHTARSALEKCVEKAWAIQETANRPGRRTGVFRG